jgi:hypothetical protein
MGAFVSWIAGQHEERQQRLRARMLEIRSQGSGRAIHARLPAALAELQSGWEQFLEFALEVGAISRTEQQELEERSRRAFAQLCTLQAKYQQASDPALPLVALSPAAQEAKQARSARAGSKTAQVLDLLQRAGGATTQELRNVTGWQPHSVRGFLSGRVGNKMGLTVTSTKGEDGQRRYSVQA